MKASARKSGRVRRALDHGWRARRAPSALLVRRSGPVRRGLESGGEVGGGRTFRASVALALATALALAVAAPAAGQPGTISREEALAAVFPGAEIVSERVFLTREQADRIAELAREEVSSRLSARYLATIDGEVVGRAYIDTHVVRTKRESLLISLEPDGRVRRIDVTAFLEPPEYLARDAWLRQYHGRPLDDDLSLRRAIRSIGGATLTARAVNSAVRRVLALDMVYEGRDTIPER